MAGSKTRKAKRSGGKRRLAKRPKKTSKRRSSGGSKNRRISQTVKTIVNTSGGGGSGGTGYQPPIINARSDPSHPQYIPQEINPVPEKTVLPRGRANPIDIGVGPDPQVGIPFVGQGPSLHLGGAPSQQPSVSSANPNFNRPRVVPKPRRVVVDESMMSESIPSIARSHDPAPTLSEQISGYATDLSILPSDDQVALSRGNIRASEAIRREALTAVRTSQGLRNSTLKAGMSERRADRASEGHAQRISNLRTILHKSGWVPQAGQSPVNRNLDMNETIPFDNSDFI